LQLWGDIILEHLHNLTVALGKSRPDDAYSISFPK
jgi:hypothetical protein